MAAALAEQGADAASRAHHVAVAAEPGDDEAVALLREAAASSVARAPESAAHWLGRAVDLARAGDDDARRDLLAELGRAQLAAGMLAEARDSIAAAIDLAGAPDVRLMVDLAEIDQWNGDVRGAIDLLERVAADSAAEPAVTALLELRLLYLCRWTAEIEKAFQHGQSALAAAEEHDVPLVRAGATAAFAEVAASFDPPQGRELYARAVELMAQVPDSGLGLALDSFYSLGWAAIHLERYDEAIGAFRARPRGRPGGPEACATSSRSAPIWSSR